MVMTPIGFVHHQHSVCWASSGFKSFIPFLTTYQVVYNKDVNLGAPGRFCCSGYLLLPIHQVGEQETPDIPLLRITMGRPQEICQPLMVQQQA